MRVTTFIAILVSLAPFAAQGDSGHSATRNKEIIRQCNALRNDGDLDGAANCFADNLTHQGQPVTRGVLLNVLKDMYAAFPDYHTEIHELVAADDIVIERSTVSGTHKGTAKGRHNGGMLADVPPTMRRFEIQHIHWWKLRDGKVVEHYAGRDDLGLMRQLGLIALEKPPAQSAEPVAQP